jgi:hypothetical protein
MSLSLSLSLFHMKTKTQPVSETVCFSSYLELRTMDDGLWTQPTNPVILSVMHHRQNPLDSTYLASSTTVFPNLWVSKLVQMRCGLHAITFNP